MQKYTITIAPDDVTHPTITVQVESNGTGVYTTGISIAPGSTGRLEGELPDLNLEALTSLAGSRSSVAAVPETVSGSVPEVRTPVVGRAARKVAAKKGAKTAAPAVKTPSRKPRTPMPEDFAGAYQQVGGDVKALADHFGVSYQTAYGWRNTHLRQAGKTAG